ncbi:MAG: ATP-dependent RNA helicase [Spirochaetaceae bacterium]|jgi:HrpA-like RNA helicase|nr:ATP-dependent RNA helicase [Spirochaetaceae bacterium]
MNYLELPVYKHRDLILAALEKSQAVVVESPTGSGKTTQLPVILHGAGYAEKGIIGVTQPRRIAAVSVSEFIARQLQAAGNDPLLVGYKMRFEDRTTPAAKIKIMTDGILLQEMKLDPWLSKYSLLVVDEAHERSLNIDFILGLLKRVLEARRDFRVIISSATINAAVFSWYFGECPVVKIDAETWPVTVIYDPPAALEGTPAEDALLDKIDGIAVRAVTERREGDMLIFLPGEKMIKNCMSRLAFGPVGKRLHLVPLYGRLGKEEQERVFDPAPRGLIKAVIATNIAETSVTIDGITTVIDSGLSKLNFYNPKTFTASLLEGPVSKASANQRKGRAGRTREGNCYRLYTRKDFENRPLFTTEEIFRTDLSEVVLRMADLGITAFEEFDFISPPGAEGIIAAIETLNLLSALEKDRSLSRIGKMMTEFPLPPRQSRIIVEAVLHYPDVTQETLIAAAFLSTQSPYLLPPGEETDARRAHHRFRDSGGDFVSYLVLFRAYTAAPNRAQFCEANYLDEKALAEIVNVTSQLEEIVSGMGVPILEGGGIDDYLTCIATGLVQFLCVREGRELYRSLTADRILIHPGSVMFRQNPPYIVAGEIIRTTRMYAMSVSPLSRTVLERLKPEVWSAFGARGQGQGDRPKKARDFTNNIRIGSEVFEITDIKGRKNVILPWEKLSLVKENVSGGAVSYRGLKGTILVNGVFSLLAGEKLSLILRLLPALSIENAVNRVWPRKASFSSRENLPALLEQLSLPALPAVWKKGRKELGFITLCTDGVGNYWFKCSRAFHICINESLASVETLIDELGEEVDIGDKHTVNLCYRRLSSLLA